YLHAGLTHSRSLTALISGVLSHAGLCCAQLDGYVVTTGPGSYTGLRIGLATVKGMAMAQDRPCVGVSTLHALAYNLLACDGIVCAVLDARVSQVFAALFEVRDGQVRRLTPDDAMTLEALGSLLPDGARAVGDGAELACERFGKEKGLRLAPAPLRFARASSAGLAAALERLPACRAAELAPNYHRLSQAERERAAGQGGIRRCC
ncbi:MAG: tRNA (adenosine(37)-N6)-threonylcarbamoyltransferase complex dimerization subunit type 1 TsaB, partial [Oscillospiraceae bacterium]